MDFLRSKLFAYLVTVLAIVVAVWQVTLLVHDNTEKFTTLCEVQEQFLNDVITVRQDTVDNPDTSAGEKEVARAAVKSYKETLAILHQEFPEGC